MGRDTNGEWDGICACGKKEADGVRCRLGATHKPYEPRMPMPWEVKQEPKEKFPWQP
jgi:hypothetical protein